MKVFALSVRTVTVAGGRQGALWLLRLAAALRGYSQPQPRLLLTSGRERPRLPPHLRVDQVWY